MKGTHKSSFGSGTLSQMWNIFFQLKGTIKFKLVEYSYNMLPLAFITQEN